MKRLVLTTTLPLILFYLLFQKAVHFENRLINEATQQQLTKLTNTLEKEIGETIIAIERMTLRWNSSQLFINWHTDADKYLNDFPWIYGFILQDHNTLYTMPESLHMNPSFQHEITHHLQSDQHKPIFFDANHFSHADTILTFLPKPLELKQRGRIDLLYLIGKKHIFSEESSQLYTLVSIDTLMKQLTQRIEQEGYQLIGVLS